MALRQASHTEKVVKGSASEVTWKDKVDKARTARRVGKELRKDKKHSLSVTLRNRL